MIGKDNKPAAKNMEMTKLIHALGTAQILMDELYAIKNDARSEKIAYFVRDIKQATNQFIKQLHAANVVLNQIWTHVPHEDFDQYLEAKRALINRLQTASFEDVREINQMLTEVHHKYAILDVFEKFINTHCVPEVRESYREQLGYTESQYHQLKKMQEDGIVMDYAKAYENNNSHQ